MLYTDVKAKTKNATIKAKALLFKDKAKVKDIQHKPKSVDVLQTYVHFVREYDYTSAVPHKNDDANKINRFF